MFDVCPAVAKIQWPCISEKTEINDVELTEKLSYSRDIIRSYKIYINYKKIYATLLWKNDLIWTSMQYVCLVGWSNYRCKCSLSLSRFGINFNMNSLLIAMTSSSKTPIVWCILPSFFNLNKNDWASENTRSFRAVKKGRAWGRRKITMGGTMEFVLSCRLSNYKITTYKLTFSPTKKSICFWN